MAFTSSNILRACAAGPQYWFAAWSDGGASLSPQAAAAPTAAGERDAHFLRSPGGEVGSPPAQAGRTRARIVASRSVADGRWTVPGVARETATYVMRRFPAAAFAGGKPHVRSIVFGAAKVRPLSAGRRPCDTRAERGHPHGRRRPEANRRANEAALNRQALDRQ